MTTAHVNIGEWRAIGFSLDRQMVDHERKIFIYSLFID
jgi:hypothetical protein